MFHCLADLYTDASHSPGYLIANCAVPCSDNFGTIRKQLATLREARRDRLCSRFQAAKASGDLPFNANAEDFVRFILTAGWGVALEPQSGAARESNSTAPLPLGCNPGSL